MSELNHLRRGAPKVKRTTKTAETVTAPTVAVKSGGGTIIGLLAGFLIALVLLKGLPEWNYDFGGGNDEDRQHRHEQVEPAQGGMLVFMSDKQLPTVDQDLLMRKMPELSKARGMEFLWLDDTDPAGEKLKAIAESKGIAFPLVGYVKDKEVKRVAKWPADEAALQTFLK